MPGLVGDDSGGGELESHRGHRGHRVREMYNIFVVYYTIPSNNTKMEEHRIVNVLSSETIGYILSRPEVGAAKQRVIVKASATEHFTIPLTAAIRSELYDKMGLRLSSSTTTIPMRWIKGDTAPHHDTGVSPFTHTHLVYLTDSAGRLIIDGVEYPIRRGDGFIFSEGLSHETAGTSGEPRLLLGPMSETGFAVGAPSIYYPGGTTVYLRQNAVGEPVYYSADLSNWAEVYWNMYVVNSDPSFGLLHIEFLTDITFDGTVGGINGYFICGSNGIQFGSRILKQDGTRPVITISGITDYPGLIQNGNGGGDGATAIYVMNLEIRAAGGATLVAGGGWFGQAYFGKGTPGSNNIILNCHSTGATGSGCGGIIGQYAGPVKCVSCSSSGVIGTYGGGIIGANSPSTAGSLACESCWSTGVIGAYGGGITGQSTGPANIANCYSTGNMNQNAGGISGRYSGSYHIINDCYSRGAIGDYGGGIIGSECGEVIITNCYSVSAIPASGGGILGNQLGNTTNKTVSNCYAVGATSHVNGGYMIPGYSDLTGAVNVASGVVTLSGNATSTSWSNATANTALTGVPSSSSAPVGAKWVYAGANTPYEIYAMGYTPYARTVITGTPPAMVRSFATTVVSGDAQTSAPGIIRGDGRVYAIYRITDGVSASYGEITVDRNTGVISTSRATLPGVYTLTIRNSGSYHFTMVSLTVLPRPPYSMFGLYTDNAQVYYKSHSLASGGVGTVRNHRKKARRT